MLNEKTNTDQFVRNLIDDIEVKYDEQTSSIREIHEALKTASKKRTGKVGKPEFVFLSKEYLIVVEDKVDIDKLVVYTEDNKISKETKALQCYAVNGAVHYAKHIALNTSFKKIFAIGIAGDRKHHEIKPYFVSEDEVVGLTNLETFENLRPSNIERYFKLEVLKEVPPEEIELRDIITYSKDLHEDLRNYGQLSEQEKPLVVSAILLAMEDINFSINSLIGNDIKTDGDKIFEALKNYLEKVKVAPDVKKQVILDQFTFIKTRVQLNKVNNTLGKTPLRYFTESLDTNIRHAIKSNIKEDVLGRFYGEFVKYSGGDGKGLGIVLTPTHITELMCDLVGIKSMDVVLDPSTGTGTFLLSAMNKMIAQVINQNDIENIKRNQLHGVEIREDLFTIATTNMILRGDGKSNLRRNDIFSMSQEEMAKIKATVGLMNPPYSQAKTEDTQHLSELSFILKLLNSLEVRGRCAVIVPQSTMIGKNKNDKNIKKIILDGHTLESVVTLNKDTFYGVGTNPCIAVFTAGIPQDEEKRVKFINFSDDGYKVVKHIGLVATELAKDRKKQLLDAYFDKKEVPTSFMVKSNVTAEDEWLHSYFYYNDEIPTLEDFKNSIANFMTFEFNMRAHGKGYIFNGGEANES
ncbi:MAG: restriction enzyme [Clostridiaceae bacterium]|jgi:type I restriction-modification system DNA methylase subunit|nr:restriction enzyme [Clostridiaceae bacterium]